MFVLLSFIIGYFAGSIPTAYLFVRRSAGVDIREQGSGNVGALNAFSVTQSKKTGIIVGLLDGVKGFAVAFTAGQIIGGSFLIQSSALIGAIVGHNYPIWLNFKGGRGLATVAGGFFAIGISYTVIWCLTWFASFRIFKDVLYANMIAIILAPIIVVFLPFSLIDLFMLRTIPATEYRYFTFIISGVLLLSHMDVVKTLLTKQV